MSCFNKVAILGPGLLGGSIALAMKARMASTEFSLWGRRDEVIEEATAAGVTEATSNIQVALENTDLVILAVPVGVMPVLVQQMDLSSQVLVTDVGSVKRVVHQSLAPFFKGTGSRFIGSHPMAGSERAGFSAARENLLNGAACIMTNDGNAPESDMDSIQQFWQQLGLVPRVMTAEDHDYAVARISHFPHTIASVAAKVGLEFEDIAHLAGGGMRDTTRVAAGDPNLWTEILMENADALQKSLTECAKELEIVTNILKQKDEAALNAYLTSAKHKRELI